MKDKIKEILTTTRNIMVNYHKIINLVLHLIVIILFVIPVILMFTNELFVVNSTGYGPFAYYTQNEYTFELIGNYNFADAVVTAFNKNQMTITDLALNTAKNTKVYTILIYVALGVFVLFQLSKKRVYTSFGSIVVTVIFFSLIKNNAYDGYADLKVIKSVADICKTINALFIWAVIMSTIETVYEITYKYLSDLNKR